MINSGFVFISLICSAAINLCCSLQIKIGEDKFLIFFNLKKVSWRNDFSLSGLHFRNCFGKLCLDKGHNLEPEPPHIKIGIILCFEEILIL